MPRRFRVPAADGETASNPKKMQIFIIDAFFFGFL